MSIPARRLATSTTSRCLQTPGAADEWFKDNDPEGVAFGYEVLGDETRPRSYCPACGALIDTRDLSQILAHARDT
jgi:hypothetical protein